MEMHSGCAVVFDSGIGGLNLLYECVRRAGRLKYYYMSDGHNVPYGNRSRQEILALTLKALKGIESLKPAALVVACNTVTANCIEDLRARFPFPVVGIQPAVKQAAQVGGRCLVLATKATVASPSFMRLINSNVNSDAVAVGCGGLAEFVEENVLNLPETLPEVLLPDEKADCVVLGCTHYLFVKRQIEAKYRCPVFDGIGATADHFAKIVGTVGHSKPLLGKLDHFGIKKPNITFIGGNCDKNSQIFNKIIKTNV